VIGGAGRVEDDVRGFDSEVGGGEVAAVGLGGDLYTRK